MNERTRKTTKDLLNPLILLASAVLLPTTDRNNRRIHVPLRQLTSTRVVVRSACAYDLRHPGWPKAVTAQPYEKSTNNLLRTQLQIISNNCTTILLQDNINYRNVHAPIEKERDNTTTTVRQSHWNYNTKE